MVQNLLISHFQRRITGAGELESRQEDDSVRYEIQIVPMISDNHIE